MSTDSVPSINVNNAILGTGSSFGSLSGSESGSRAGSAGSLGALPFYRYEGRLTPASSLKSLNGQLNQKFSQVS